MSAPERTDWLTALGRLREQRIPSVLVTLAAVRGHTPRAAGAKMVVTTDGVWGSIGGGNLEIVAVERARSLIMERTGEPVMITANLSDKAPVDHGVQCCGGEVTVLLDPLPVPAAVAIFGVGHVGLELARILARHDLDLHLIDSRPEQLAEPALAPLADAVARIRTHHVSVLPELVLAELPAGTHVLIMTHDHAEDAALVDAALRSDQLGSIGLIGSSAKWARFRKKLLADGHSVGELDKITTPVGLPELTGKEPATIAIGIAAALLQSMQLQSMERRPEAVAPEAEEAR